MVPIVWNIVATCDRWMAACSASVRYTSPWPRVFEDALIFDGFGAALARPAAVFFFPAFFAIHPPRRPTLFLPGASLTPGSCAACIAYSPCSARRDLSRKSPGGRAYPANFGVRSALDGPI